MKKGIKPKETNAFKETVVEMKDKFASDVKGTFSFKRMVSLRRLVPCDECAATGKTICATCEGSGIQKLMWNDETKECEACDGLKEVICWNCDGRKYVPNKNRKYVLWTVMGGSAAWALIIYWLVWPHFFPEQQAKYLAGGGGGGLATQQVRVKSASEQPAQKMGQGRRFAPGGGMASPGSETITTSPGGQPR